MFPLKTERYTVFPFSWQSGFHGHSFHVGLLRSTKGGIALIWRALLHTAQGDSVILTQVLTSHTARGGSWCGLVQGLSDCSHRRAAAASPEDTLENSQAASQSCWTGSSGWGPAISVLVFFPGGFWCLIKFENHWLGHANSYTECSVQCIMVQRLKQIDIYLLLI